MPGTVLGAEDLIVTQTDIVPSSTALSVEREIQKLGE